MDYGVDTVRVPGARLRTQVGGAGPALLLIPGGGGDAEMYAEVVPLLADRFTVLTYDRRGNSRSPLDAADAPVDVATQADDAIAVLDQHGVDRAYLFGNSSGAIVALDVVARHHDRLLGAVVHEPPPMLGLLPDSPEQRELDGLRRTADAEGPLRGFVAFAAMTMPRPPKPFTTRTGRALTAAAMRLVLAGSAVRTRVTGRPPGGMTRLLGNAGILFRRELPAFCYEYRPDLDALAETELRWRLATGADSVGRPYHRPAHLIGARTGVPCVEFPGGHTAYQQRPDEFARCLIGHLAP